VKSRTLEAPPSLPQEPQEQLRQSKKIAVKVYMVRAETEEIVVEQQKAGNTTLTATRDIKNKVDAVFVSPRSSMCRSRS
jgi:hypothetical protein